MFLFSDDLESFGSVDAMLRYVEPWDVGEDMQAFDARGHRLKLRADGVVHGKWTVGSGTTLLDEARSGEPASEEMARLLRNYAVRLGCERFGVTEGYIEGASLAELVAMVAPFTHTS